MSRVPYMINKADNGTVEVNLYGEVVESVPVDWWTGEKVNGLFIELEAFLQDLDTLKDASDITFHINSVGGDVAAGLSIYNRIKGLSGHTTTVVDGIAASAASIIAQAGDTRQVSVGSQTMIHGASAGLLGYYNVQDLNRITAQLDATNESIAEVYAQKTGKDVQSIIRMMKKETWMTSEEAVSEGFADEVIGKEVPVVDRIEDTSCILVNGIPHNMHNTPLPSLNYRIIPKDVLNTRALNLKDIDIDALKKAMDESPLQIVNGCEPSAIDSINSTKEETIMTLEELKANHPDLVKQIQDEAAQAACEAKEQAVKDALSADRARMKEIDAIAQMVGDPEMVNKAKYDEPIEAQALAFEAMKAAQAAGETFMANRSEELKATEGVSPSANGGMEDTVAHDEAELNSLIAKLKKEA